MIEINEKTTIKDFMEWYATEYDGYILSSDYERTINMLDGYRMGKQVTEESTMLSSAVNLLRDARNFFDIVSRYSKWKYKGE